MALAVKHPSVLSDWQLFRQAKLITKHTSRASNPDWYREAHELDRQWHIWIDGAEIVSAIFDKRSGQWFEGPEPVLPRDTGASIGSQKPISKADVASLHQSLNEAQMEAIFANFDEDGLRKLHETLSRIVQGKDFGGKSKSLGVILHMADEFGTSDLAPGISADTDFESVRDLCCSDPQTALGDLNADSVGNSWRALPYWGVNEGERRSVAIQMSRRAQSLFFELDRYAQSRNIPVITAAYAAPLEALRLAPFLLDAEAPHGKGDILVFQYRRFSVLAVISVEQELIQMRVLPHRMGMDYPNSLGEVLSKTAAMFGLEDAAVTIAAMSQVNQDAMVADLSAYFSENAPMNIGLVAPGEIDAFSSLAGKGRCEMAIGDAALLKRLSERNPMAESTTFKQLGEGWATQNFFGISEEEREIFPPLRDLRLLRFFMHAKLAAAAAVLGLGIWTGFEFVRAATSDSWHVEEQAAGGTTAELTKLQKDRNRFEYWENLMARRSEGWLAMELLVQLFRPDSGLVVSESNYKVEGNYSAAGEKKSRGKAAEDASGKKLGFTRTWVISGYSKPEGTAALTKLSSESFLQQQFEKMAKEFKSESLFAQEGTRTLEVTMQQKQGQMPPSKRFPMSVARHYRNSFEITITQTFTDKDSLALTMAPPKAPQAAQPAGPAMASAAKP